MQAGVSRAPYVCARCARARAGVALARGRDGLTTRGFASSRQRRQDRARGDEAETKEPSEPKEPEERGALSRRLEQMSEESLESGGRGARNAVREAGFDEGLRRRLEERIAAAAGASFRSEHAGAIAQANLPAGADRNTRDTAGARPWMGSEAVEDTALRMLSDAHRPMRSGGGGGSARTVRAPRKVDTGRPSSRRQHGQKLADARNRSSLYSSANEGGMSGEDRERFRRELKARFEGPAGARAATPASLQGLAGLANERIEDAIARGQFKNLPRGRRLERDYNASSPFIDTTEYLMNHMIQRQDIVPPWIEKQQELVGAATRFRARLRSDWRRHAARAIASLGGTLDERVRRAEEFAAAEMLANPPRARLETLNAVDAQGHVSQITLAGELKTTPASADDAAPVVTEEDIRVIETMVDNDTDTNTNAPPSPLHSPDVASSTIELKLTPPPADPSQNPPVKPAAHPFRDLAWLATEQSYLAHAVAHLNALTRSYNLVAPDLAKKPFFRLERELDAAYRDVAPRLADEIRERARGPPPPSSSSRPRVRVVGAGGGGVLGGASDAVRVWDEGREKQYGLREFWRDLFAKAS